jgi:hypothetical protein
MGTHWGRKGSTGKRDPEVQAEVPLSS